MSLTITLTAAVISSATLAQAGEVMTYSNSIEPSRSEGLISERGFTPAADPRAQLLNPAPYPNARTDGPARVENGRLWHSRSPVGNRTPIRELPRVANGGPAAFGAPPELLDEVIFVQTSIPNVGVIAISPWDDLDTRTIESIRRDDPRLGRRDRPTDFRGEPLLYEGETRRRSGIILRELKAAQRLWLKENGYILKVRTHVNPLAGNGATTRPAATGQPRLAPTEPRGVIRVKPQENESERRADATESERRPPIVVVRPASGEDRVDASSD